MIDLALLAEYAEKEYGGFEEAEAVISLFSSKGLLTGPHGLRRMLAEKYPDYFCKAYLPNQFSKPMGSYAVEMMNDIAVSLHSHMADKKAKVVFRNAGKSTICTFGMTTYATCFGLRTYILFLSSSDDIASNFLEKDKVALESPDIIEDFGPQKGTTWNAQEIKTRNGVSIECNGWTSGLRGKNKDRRPDWVIFDDLEDKKVIESPSLREKLEKSFDEEMMRLGDIDTLYLYVGTFLAPDSLLVKVSQRPMWDTKVYKKVLSFPVREDLWDDWRKIIRDMAIPQDERLDKAYVFYTGHKEDMLQGVSILWPGQYPDDKVKYPGAYYNIMLQREDSENAFWQEDQNDPQSTSNLAFKDIQTWKTWPAELVKLKLAVDPSEGKGDPAAYCAGGTLNGALFVKDAMLANHGSFQTIDNIVWFIKKYPQIDEVILESNLFKDILKKQLEDRLKAERMPDGSSCYRTINNRYSGENKHIRIMKMEPDSTSGKILLNPYNVAFNKNVKEYHDKVSHDDGPDVLQMLHSRMTSAASAWLEYARRQAEKTKGEQRA